MNNGGAAFPVVTTDEYNNGCVQFEASDPCEHRGELLMDDIRAECEQGAAEELEISDEKG